MINKYLIKIDEPRIEQNCDAYFKWKNLNTYVKNLVSREINMPDAISEPMSITLSNTIKDVFEFDKKVDDKYYYTM